MASISGRRKKAVMMDVDFVLAVDTSTSSERTQPERPSMDNYPALKYEFKRKSHESPTLSEEITRNNPPTKNIVRRKEIEIIRSLSDSMYYFDEAMSLMSDRRIPSSAIEETFEAIVIIGDRVIELTPVLSDAKLMVYLFERESEIALNLQNNLKLFGYNLNRKINWSYHPKEMEMYLYGVTQICSDLSNMFNRYFDKYETKSNITAIKTALKACRVFMDEADPSSLEDAQALVTESKELEDSVRGLFKTFANHSQGDKAARVVREMEVARHDSFNFYTSSGYAGEIKDYVLTALMYTGMEFKSLTRGGSQYPWVIQFTWPRDPENRKKVYTIEMSNSTKDFHFPFCVDHQNHTLIDAILVHLTQDGVNQDAVVL